MAVNLTPRFRRLESRGSLRRRGHLEPFHATQVWNNIIQALQTQVEVRHYKRFWRTYNGCFTGADAVDVVLSHLMQSMYFVNSDVSRLKAARLCHALMEHRVFEPVNTRLFGKEQQMVFEDCSSSLYRFMEDGAFPGQEQGPEDLFHHERPLPRKKCPIPDKITYSNPIALEACDKRIEEVLQAISLRPSLPTNIKIKAPTSLLPKKENGKTGQALEAAQLCVRLLEPIWREELHRLLSFMAVAACPGTYRLQKQNTNRTVVMKTFAKAIVQSKSLSKSQTEDLALFLMDNHAEVFKIPSFLLQMVRKKLLSLQEGRNPSAIADFTFCKHVTQKEFEVQKRQTTLEQLQRLIRSISQNRSLCEKERNRLLQEFRKHHPSVFFHHHSSCYLEGEHS
ncbi:DEP domain-containing protein 4 isoform X2 [Mobula hypostoma]|uniref:DEP domain-containing protein 4 isoform X2 n=1 Tax=Mobula hypostoma TaxID=723540 RepID=UPI002FC2F249